MLNDEQRREVVNDAVNDLFVRPSKTATVDTELIAKIVGATDDYLESVAQQLEDSLPSEKGMLSVEDKSRIIAHVAAKRVGSK